MSEVFIPLGGAGGKNRGDILILHNKEDIRKLNNFDAILGKLPPGLYKKKTDNKLVVPELDNREVELPGLGDGQNATIMYSKEYIKELALKAFEIASITNFRFAPRGHKQTMFTWAKPSGGAMWSGVRLIVWKKSDPEPRDPDDTSGKWVYDTADTYTITPLFPDVPHYIKAVSYVSVKGGRWYQDINSAPKLEFTPTAASGAITLGMGAGVWTVPANVYRIRFILVGQGGFGGRGDGYFAGGGGGGGYVVQDYMSVTPGQQLAWIVPTIVYKGSSYGVMYWDHPGYDINGRWDDAVVTRLGDRIAHAGSWGQVGDRDNSSGAGGKGGSGGGTGGSEYAPGGTNGSSGGGSRGGAGQGSTTVGFNGVMYASGGNGSTYNKSWFSIGDYGTDGLGNGGGGGKGQSTSRQYYQADGGKGGTGCIYIAWGTNMNDGTW